VVNSALLSIIVTGYTVERLVDIYALFDSIQAQTYPNFEVIFVAERSQELMQKVQHYVSSSGMSRARILFNDGESGLSAARNIGIKEAAGEIIGFVDDDTVLFPDWAAETVRTFADETVIGITGPAIPLWEDESMAWFPAEFYWIISCTAWDREDTIKEVRNAWGMNMAFRREAFEKAGLFSNQHGFHKGIMAEDNEFSLRVREKTSKRLMYIPAVKVKHRVHGYRLSTRFIKARSYWIGYSRRMMKKTVKTNSGNRLLSQEQRLLRRILFHLVPCIAAEIFFRPHVAWKLMRLCFVSLSSVARGYLHTASSK
jgi:GT2 family glycosyltransferase